jgi:hypothetical protein
VVFSSALEVGQEDCPSGELELNPAQAAHTDAPSEDEYSPEGQEEQTVDPLAVEYLPGAQDVQVVDTKDEENVPASHQEHPRLELIRNPDGQVSHFFIAEGSVN